MDYFSHCIQGLDRARQAGKVHLWIFKVLNTQLILEDLQFWDSEITYYMTEAEVRNNLETLEENLWRDD